MVTLTPIKRGVACSSQRSVIPDENFFFGHLTRNHVSWVKGAAVALLCRKDDGCFGS